MPLGRRSWTRLGTCRRRRPPGPAGPRLRCGTRPLEGPPLTTRWCGRAKGPSYPLLCRSLEPRLETAKLPKPFKGRPVVKAIAKRLRRLEDQCGPADGKPRFLLAVCNAGWGLGLDRGTCIQILGEGGFLRSEGCSVA